MMLFDKFQSFLYWKKTIELCHKTEKCTNVHAQIAAKTLKSLLNQKKEDQCIVVNVYQNIVVEDFKLVSFN